MNPVFAVFEYDRADPVVVSGDSSRQSSPRQWIRENLFSSVFNTALTAVCAVSAVLVSRGLLNFVFSEEREWDAVRINLRLLFTHAYPEEQFTRVWVSVGVIAVLSGLSLGLSACFTAIPVRRISAWMMATGGAVAMGVLLVQPAVLLNVDGTRLRDADGGLIRQTFMQAMEDRWLWWLAASALIGVGAAIWLMLGDRVDQVGVAAVPFALTLLGIAVGSVWLYPWGRFGFVDGDYIYEHGRTVAASTKIPWTAMWLLLVAAWVVGGALRGTQIVRRLRMAVNISWLLLPFMLYWMILRDPDFDWPHIWTVDLPMALAFAIGGAVVLLLLTRPSAGELDRLSAMLLLALAIFNWVAAFFGWYPMLQKARFSFLLLAFVALLAHNFRGTRALRARLTVGWVAVVFFMHWLFTAVNSPSTIETPTESFIGGFGITLFVAVLTLMLSFPLGVLLALARTSRMSIFRMIATSYIETVRGVPLITILIFFSVMVPLFLPSGMEIAELAAIVIGFTLFSAAYLAEYVRGGLQSLPKGQMEASDALGLTVAQRTALVVLPQALRVSIPALVGQAISVFKDTSLIAIIGAFDFLRIANNVVPAQSEFLGVKRETLLFASIVYWVAAFSMSKYSQRIEQRLGVGRR